MAPMNADQQRNAADEQASPFSAKRLTADAQMVLRRIVARAVEPSRARPFETMPPSKRLVLTVRRTSRCSARRPAAHPQVVGLPQAYPHRPSFDSMPALDARAPRWRGADMKVTNPPHVRGTLGSA